MKKSVKRFVAFAYAALLAVPALSGCGNNGVQPDGKITLKLWTKPSQDAQEYVIESHDRMMADLREKFPDIEFEEAMNPTGTDYRQEYDKALMANTAPAFFTRFSYTDIPSRIQNGTVADISKYVDNWELKKEGKILDIFDDAISKDDKWYALPLKAYTMGTLCNKKTLETAGEDTGNLPATWDEFAELGERVTDLSVPRIGYSLIGMDWCAWPFTAWVWSAGGDMVVPNDDGTYRIAFNEDAGVDTAMFMNQMIWKNKMTQKDILLDYADVKKNVLNGTSCFSFMGLNDLGDGTELKEYGLTKSDYIDMLIPSKDSSIEGSSLAGGQVITFNPKLSDKELEAAFKVVEYLYFSDERMQADCDEIQEFNTTNVMIPGRVDWYEKRLEANSGITDEEISALNVLREHAKPEPYCEHWSDVKSNLVAPLQEIYLTENVSRDKVKSLLDDCAKKLYDLYPDTFKAE